jgi:adenylosuccinate synthase
MDYASIVQTAISALGAIGVAYVGVHQRRDKQTNDLRNEGSLIQMEMAQTNLDLAKVTAKAVLNQKCNGDVEEAMKRAREVEARYDEYLRRVSRSV